MIITIANEVDLKSFYRSEFEEGISDLTLEMPIPSAELNKLYAKVNKNKEIGICLSSDEPFEENFFENLASEFKNLHYLAIQKECVKNLKGISKAKKLVTIEILSEKSDLSRLVVDETVSLKQLTIKGDVSSGLAELVCSLGTRQLTLQWMKLGDLAWIPVHVNGLKLHECEIGRFDISHKNELNYLHVFSCKTDDNLEEISNLSNLKKLVVAGQKRLISLPDFSNLKELLSLELSNLSNIDSLKPISALQKLEEIRITDMRHLTIEDFEPLKDLKNLKRGRFGLGSLKKNRMVEDYMKLESV